MMVEMKIILSADSFNIIQWWVYALYVVHLKMKGNKRIMMSLERGSAMIFSLGQMINTPSSTNTEITGIDNMILQMMELPLRKIALRS